jgi:hypothetical protein
MGAEFEAVRVADRPGNEPDAEAEAMLAAADIVLV